MAGETTVLIQGCIDRLLAGDASAQDDLFRHAQERLRRLTHRMLGNYERVHALEQTADVQQNAAVRLLRALKAVPITSARDFFRLAATQIRRELIDQSRHHFGPRGDGQRQARMEMEDSPGPTEGMTWNAERLAVWSDFHKAVETLPDTERDVVDLVWYQGLEQAEVARLLGISVPTVKRRWMRARLKLQENWPGQLPEV